jgi:hypothetical protein
VTPGPEIPVNHQARAESARAFPIRNAFRPDAAKTIVQRQNQLQREDLKQIVIEWRICYDQPEVE